VISASAAASLGGKVSQIFIPTPETKSSQIKYDDLYPKHFAQPSTYIRFSSTVEDSIGDPYCASADDDIFLTQFNQNKTEPLTVDLFEEIISFFEITASTSQPFANIDKPPVLSFQEIESSYDETISAEGRGHASEIYTYWHDLREKRLNSSLMPILKNETGAETDDTDAYVCFRRREVRQARKTRGRDAQVTEKLRKLRRELEDARQLVHSINLREKLQLDRIQIDRKVFEQRQELKRVKIQHNIKNDDDELLINQRPMIKPKIKLDTQHQKLATIKLTSRLETARPEQDLVQLNDVREEAESRVRRSVASKIHQHREWNDGYNDETWLPLCPPQPIEKGASSDYLPVIHGIQLPTPPASIEGDEMEIDDEITKPAPIAFQFKSPTNQQKQNLPTFRRRYGRGGRLHIDSIRQRKYTREKFGGVVYDSDSEDSDDVIVCPIDYWSNFNMNYRAAIMRIGEQRPNDTDTAMLDQ